MKKFLGYIAKHYMEEISLENLACAANVSKSECLRCFKQSLKTTPYKYLMNFRLEKAAELLKETSNSITEIAIMTGFNQSSYFGKCFKLKTGYAPKEYRNKKDE